MHYGQKQREKVGGIMPLYVKGGEKEAAANNQNE